MGMEVEQGYLVRRQEGVVFIVQLEVPCDTKREMVIDITFESM
jgi:hypothetical protein